MPGLPHLNPSSMTLPQTEKAFNLKEAEGYQSWQIPSIHLVLSPEFDLWLHKYDELTELPAYTEARSRRRVDSLIVAVYRSLSDQGLLQNPAGTRVTLALERPLEWGPVLHQNVPHKCSGTADYSLLFGDKDHMACHMVIIEAKRRGHFPDQGQILAYMAMVQASRRSRGQTDWTVWGVMTDGWSFQFYQLNMEGAWSFLGLQAKRDSWQAIATMLGSIVLHAQQACNSPLRPSLSSNQAPGSKRYSVASVAPRISSLQLAPMGEFMSGIQDALDADT
ncbi:hypothetical protein N7453_001900 [Penicillium expansum]|nr:hypothetical protein N7453_001900 [Penicillium expansum]